MKASLFLLLLIISVVPCLMATTAPTITTTRLLTGNATVAYSAAIVATGGCTPYKWAITSGKLPAGITSKTSSSTTALDLTGTPTAAATDSITVSVTGCNGDVAKATFSLVVDDAPLNITTTALPNATLDTAYSATLDGTGGCTPYKWAISSGTLPAGVTQKVSSSTTVLTLSGTPTAAATYSFTVALTGCGGHTDTASYKVAVQGSAKNVVNLSWKAATSTDTAGYNVYRSPNGSTWTKLNASLIASTLYSDSTVSADSTYWYSATTVNTSGKESSKTPSVKAVIP
jgi:Putative Ig domain